MNLKTDCNDSASLAREKYLIEFASMIDIVFLSSVISVDGNELLD